MNFHWHVAVKIIISQNLIIATIILVFTVCLKNKFVFGLHFINCFFFLYHLLLGPNSFQLRSDQPAFGGIHRLNLRNSGRPGLHRPQRLPTRLRGLHRHRVHPHAYGWLFVFILLAHICTILGLFLKPLTYLRDL
jgi:hypothetical protein